QMRQAPFRPALEAIAHTLVYDASLVGDGSLPTDLVASVAMPTLAIAGGAGGPFFGANAQALAEALPHGEARVLEGQTHDIEPTALGPVVEAFFAHQG
ncbi:MAG TPA: alpha/beta hydrolase, partial [Chloroflexota bacterium]